MAGRTDYAAWNITGAAEKVLAISEELKECYKNDISFPVGKKENVEKQFAPAKLFFSDKDLLYTIEAYEQEAYVAEFTEYDGRAPYRGNYKRTEVGVMFPELVTPSDIPKPGDKLVFKKQDYLSIWQDESAPIPDIHARTLVDWHLFDFSQNFLDASDYFRIQRAIYGQVNASNRLLEKAIIDYFLASVLGVYSYPYGHPLYRMFSGKDDYAPDEAYSSLGRKFYINTGEVKKRLKELNKYVNKYYVARDVYFTNVHSPEILGDNRDKTVPKATERVPDRSDEAKTLTTIREWYLEHDANSKYTHIGYSQRRNSLYAFVDAVTTTLRRMMSLDARNWCGHKFGSEDNKNQEAYPMRVRPDNLLVFVNTSDLEDILNVKGGIAEGPFTEEYTLRDRIRRFSEMGIRFYGIDFILPGMSIVMDRSAFRLVEYFDEYYDKFHEFDLVNSIVSHMMKKIVLFRKVACNTLEPAKGQKFAVPAKWAADHLPYIRETA